jgi:hypothetical protein
MDPYSRLTSKVSNLLTSLAVSAYDSSSSVNDTFENLRKGVNQVEGFETAAFMWEWFTTKPFVDSKEVS